MCELVRERFDQFAWMRLVVALREFHQRRFRAEFHTTNRGFESGVPSNGDLWHRVLVADVQKSRLDDLSERVGEIGVTRDRRPDRTRGDTRSIGNLKLDKNHRGAI